MRRLALVLSLALAACATSTRQSSDALYRDLGGESGVVQLVDALTAAYHQDEHLGPMFAETDDAYFKERLREQICELAGGGCAYTGLSMEEAHSGMNLSPAHFNRFVDVSRRAMTDIDLPVPTQNRLLALLAPMRESVIRQ